MLLLGAGESGKSTLFKQMKVLDGGKEFTDVEKQNLKPVIHNNTICAMLDIIGGIPTVLNKKKIKCDVKAQKELQAVSKMSGSENITPELGEIFKTLWEDPGIQEAYKNRSCFQLIDSAEYFFNRIWDTQEIPITSPEWMPTEKDILRCRVRTTGILDMEFEYKSNVFKVFDVGGQRNERKKWIHCFEGVTAVLFVGVLSEYDLVLYEDEKQNRMVETLKLFADVANQQWFVNTEIILFLNKKDLFEQKIARVPLTVCDEIWKDDHVICRTMDGKNKEWIPIEDEGFYTSPTPFEAGCARIKEQFYDQIDNKRAEYCHLTSAIDKDNFRFVFNEVKEIIVKQGLNAAGLLG